MPSASSATESSICGWLLLPSPISSTIESSGAMDASTSSPGVSSSSSITSKPSSAEPSSNATESTELLMGACEPPNDSATSSTTPSDSKSASLYSALSNGASATEPSESCGCARATFSARWSRTRPWWISASHASSCANSSRSS
eukprot:6006702-Pleurochrysis_carterae.AAC.1